MSDCSTQAMMPKERRTCRTCKNVNAVWLDCFHAANDSSYYMRCTRPDMRACEHYVDDPDSLPRRYEHLAQVTLWMYDTMRDFCAKAYADEAKERLKQCGVSVDD